MTDEQEAREARPILDPDGVRFSRLKLFAESPLHYLADVRNASGTLDKGSAVHSVLLGGKRVTFYDKVTANGSSAPRRGAEWEAFKAANEGAIILSRSEYETSNRIADAVRNCPLAMLALDGVKEETLRFDFLKLACRSTPDVRGHKGEFVTELKTCKSSNPFRFTWQSKTMYYHAQMAFHREAMRRAGLWKETPPIPYVVAVCSTAPYPVTVFKMTDKAMDAGDRMIRLWFEQLKTCLSSKQFPAYAQSVVDLDVPDNELVFADGDTESVEVPF